MTMCDKHEFYDRKTNAPCEECLKELGGENETTSCLSCRKDDNRTDKPCPTRIDCFFPDYKNWEPIGEETEDTGCATCHHWAAVKIGTFCPDCGQPITWT